MGGRRVKDEAASADVQRDLRAMRKACGDVGLHLRREGPRVYVAGAAGEVAVDRAVYRALAVLCAADHGPDPQAKVRDVG